MFPPARAPSSAVSDLCPLPGLPGERRFGLRGGGGGGGGVPSLHHWPARKPADPAPPARGVPSVWRPDPPLLPAGPERGY